MLAFGDFFNAQVATLGLNPSNREFLSRKKALLVGSKRRLESLQSLGLSDYGNATTIHHERLLDACIRYFQGSNSYSWFRRFDPILNQLGVSYQSGTACHLDLFQTATDPVWSGLKKSERDQYIQNEGWFFVQQLSSHSIDKLLLNGRSVVNAFTSLLGVSLLSSKHCGPGGESFEFFRGHVSLCGRTIDVRGWNINIQSSHVKGGAPVAAIGALCV